MDLPENGLKWICNKDGLKVDLPEKWIENGFARQMDSTNFQFDKVGYHQENLFDLKAGILKEY